ncbi:hypothetical protein acdb102_00280 [Acidothermaceae bacterium B102]|nr:hypothetical protein acdb102_00280 [Acidothermaceae bacterium B102]
MPVTVTIEPVATVAAETRALTWTAVGRLAAVAAAVGTTERQAADTASAAPHRDAR